jgi:hypothetical protein
MITMSPGCALCGHDRRLGLSRSPRRAPAHLPEEVCWRQVSARCTFLSAISLNRSMMTAAVPAPTPAACRRRRYGLTVLRSRPCSRAISDAPKPAAALRRISRSRAGVVAR